MRVQLGDDVGQPARVTHPHLLQFTVLLLREFRNRIKNSFVKRSRAHVNLDGDSAIDKARHDAFDATCSLAELLQNGAGTAVRIYVSVD